MICMLDMPVVKCATVCLHDLHDHHLMNPPVGRTQEIRVRLRRPRDPCSFYDYEHVLGTMLHELVHNVRGPHDK